VRYEHSNSTSTNYPHQPPIQGERHAFQGTGAREEPAKMGTHHVFARDGAKERLLLLHRRKGAIHRMARVARQEDNREVDGRDQEDYQIGDITWLNIFNESNNIVGKKVDKHS